MSAKTKAHNQDRFVIIMAGGRGERFWPLSREKMPKQLLALLARGLRNRQLRFPAQNCPVEWPAIQLVKKTA